MGSGVVAFILRPMGGRFLRHRFFVLLRYCGFLSSSRHRSGAQKCARIERCRVLGFRWVSKNLSKICSKFWCFTSRTKTTTKKTEPHEKSMRSRSMCRFHEKSKPCIEKFVPFTKNPVWGYIIFISTNRKVHFSYRSSSYFAIFRGFFVLHEKFSFFRFF